MVVQTLLSDLSESGRVINEIGILTRWKFSCATNSDFTTSFISTSKADFSSVKRNFRNKKTGCTHIQLLLQNPLCLYGNTVFQDVHALKSSFYAFLVFSCVEDTCQKNKSSPHYQTLDIFLTLTSGDSRRYIIWNANLRSTYGLCMHHTWTLTEYNLNISYFCVIRAVQAC